MVVTASGMAELKRDGRHRSCWCACAGQRRCRCPGDSAGVCLGNSFFDRLGTGAVGWPGDVAPDLGDVVELLRKSFMSVPERASVAAKRASRLDRREAGVVGSWNGTDRPRVAVGRQGRHRNVPATIPPRSCVRWHAAHPGIEALERRLPFVDLVAWPWWFTNVRPCLGIRTASTRQLTRDLRGAPGHAAADRDRRPGRPGALLPDVPGFESCRWWWPMPSHASRWPGQVASRNPANLTRAVRAPSGSWSAPAWAEPRA